MERKDKAGKHGFYIDEEQLAHELTILHLQKYCDIDPNAVSLSDELYKLYVKQLNEYRDLIDDRTRYDEPLD